MRKYIENRHVNEEIKVTRDVVNKHGVPSLRIVK